jgi:hypothetical protein
MNRPLLRAVFAGTLVLIAAKGYCRTQVNVSSAQRPEVYQPVADPAAVVTLEHARFTVLTPQLIRMEWAADSKFEDHASFAFLNRRLPVPPFHWHVAGHGTRRVLTIDTSSLHLTYRAGHNGDRFTTSDLSIDLKATAEKNTWHPG